MRQSNSTTGRAGNRVALFALALVWILSQPAEARKKRAKQERVAPVCSGLSLEQRPSLGVMDFEEKGGVTGAGGAMATMLMNALTETGCFRVVETERLDEVLAEQRLGMSGAIQQDSAAAVGQLSGAQLLVMGTVTEFTENESNTDVNVARATRRRGGLLGGIGGIIGGVSQRTAHIGFVIRVVDPNTRSIILSKSFDKKRKTRGVRLAGGWWGGDALNALGFRTKAMGDALEEALIEAVSVIARERSLMLEAVQASATLRTQTTQVTPTDCASLQSGRSPRIMVMIPEEHIMGEAGRYAADRNPYGFEEHEIGDSGVEAARNQAQDMAEATAALARRMIRPPDPAGETEIAKRLIAFGFDVVDASQLETLRQERLEQFLRVHDDSAVAASIGREHGADIVITGEAFSEFSSNLSEMYSCRARVEAKAVDAHTGRIIATDGLHGSALDVSEIVAGKKALRNAGGLVADYFINEICKATPTTQSVAQAPTVPSGRQTRLTVSNIDYQTSSNFSAVLSELSTVKEATKSSFRDGTAEFAVSHGGSTEDLADQLVERAKSMGIEITGMAAGELALRLQR